MKPANILITSDEVAKVTDFGLAKSVMEGGENIVSSSVLGEEREKHIMVDGGTCGTPPYMPPEQWGHAETADTKADIYSFGCVLYEMLTEELPFGSKGSLEYFRRAHLNKNPESPKTKNSEVPTDLENLVMKCLEKDPRKRYDSFANLREELVWIYQREVGEEISLVFEPSALEAWELVNKGAALGNLGLYEEAIVCYDKALEIDEADVDVWWNKSITLTNLERHEEAIDCYDKVLKIDEKHYEAWYNKGFELYHHLERHEEAIDCFDKTLEIDERFADAWYNKGTAFFFLNQYDEAIECYDKELESNERNAEAWFSRGNALHYLERYEEVIECFDKALEIDETYAEAWYNKGSMLADLEQYEEAIECYDKALEIDERHRKAWFNKGSALGRLDQYKEAIVCYDKALEIFEGDAEAWCAKGVVLYYLHRYEEAIECADRAIEINPLEYLSHRLKALCLDALRRR